jgi:hypothetical protein
MNGVIESLSLTWYEYACLGVVFVLIDVAFLLTVGWGVMNWFRNRGHRADGEPKRRTFLRRGE